MKYLPILLTAAFLMLSSLSGFSQEESWYLNWSNIGEWQKPEVEEDAEQTIHQLHLTGETETDWTVQASLTVTHKPLRSSVDQIMKNIGDDIRPDYQPAKMTIVEKHSGFDAPIQFAIFLVESKKYKPTGKPQSTLFQIVIGEYHTYIVSLSAPVAKLSGKQKKSWTKFLKEGKFKPQSTEASFNQAILTN